VTDAPSRQGSPEDEDGQPSAGGEPQDVPQNVPQSVPQWSAEQPEPAPWFLGRPGAAPPQGWPPVPMPPAPPMPPPTPDQANWPYQAPGMRPEQGPGQNQGQGQAPGGGSGSGNGNGGGNGGGSGNGGGNNGDDNNGGSVPPWTGQAPPNPEHPYPNTGHGPGPGAPPPAPWLDPNRYSQPGGRPQRPDQGEQYRRQQPPQQQRREEQEKRPPLSLQTRWARGLAMGGAACTLITLLNGYHNFPSWLIGAAIGLLMSLGGLWLGVFAQRDALRRQERAPEAVAAVVWSSISTLITVGIVAFSLIFYPQLHQYSECMRSANTIAAQNICQQQLNNSRTLAP
jgi:hypothetical protein